MPEDPLNPRRDDDDSLFQRKNWFSDKIVDFLADWTPKCTEMTHLISEEMDHSLPWRIRFKMRAHYLMCCYCENYKNNLYYIRSLLQHLQDHLSELSVPTLSLEEKERMKRVLRNEAGST
jgi:hypothetical protein